MILISKTTVAAVCLVEIVLLLILLLYDLQVLRVLDLLWHNVLVSKGQVRKNNAIKVDIDLDPDKIRRKTEILAQYLSVIFIFVFCCRLHYK
jgi:hypothetical protein